MMKVRHVALMAAIGLSSCWTCEANASAFFQVLVSGTDDYGIFAKPGAKLLDKKFYFVEDTDPLQGNIYNNYGTMVKYVDQSAFYTQTPHTTSDPFVPPVVYETDYTFLFYFGQGDQRQILAFTGLTYSFSAFIGGATTFGTSLVDYDVLDFPYQYKAVTDLRLDVSYLNFPPVVDTVPLPAAAPMFGAALVVLAAAGLGLKRKTVAA